MTDGQTRRRRRGNLLSNLFAVAAIAFGLLAAVLYIRNPGGGVAPVPTPAPTVTPAPTPVPTPAPTPAPSGAEP